MTKRAPIPTHDPDAMGVVAYYRVSSRAQSMGMQESAVERAVRARDDVLTHTYRETLTAKSIERPALSQLRTDARAGKVRWLYVYRIDRLARSGIRDTLSVVQELRAHGVEVVSVADGFDLYGPAAEIVLAVMAWAAQMERRAIGERIRSAIDRAHSDGRTWGMPPRMSPDERERARAMRLEGRTIRAIAIALKVPKTIVQRALSGAPSKKKESE